MSLMAAPPASTKTSLQQRLSEHARTHWPQLAGVTVRFRGAFAYVDGQLPDGETLPLMRLRYGGSAARWASGCTCSVKKDTKTRSCPPAPSLACPKTHSTAPLASTSATHALTNPRRTYKPDHLACGPIGISCEPLPVMSRCCH